VEINELATRLAEISKAFGWVVIVRNDGTGITGIIMGDEEFVGEYERYDDDVWQLKAEVPPCEKN
jgi:hypothetical protein